MTCLCILQCTKNTFDDFMSEIKYGFNRIHQYLCCNIETYNICLWKKWFKSYDQNINNFIYLEVENENLYNYSDNDNDLQEPHDSDDDTTIDVYFIFSNDGQSNHACINV